MQSLRRAPLQARLAGRSLMRQQPRRAAHDSHGAHHDAHPAPANESFGVREPSRRNLHGFNRAAYGYLTDCASTERVLHRIGRSASRLRGIPLHSRRWAGQQADVHEDDRGIHIKGAEMGPSE